MLFRRFPKKYGVLFIIIQKFSLEVCTWLRWRRSFPGDLRHFRTTESHRLTRNTTTLTGILLNIWYTPYVCDRIKGLIGCTASDPARLSYTNDTNEEVKKRGPREGLCLLSPPQGIPIISASPPKTGTPVISLRYYIPRLWTIHSDPGGA